MIQYSIEFLSPRSNTVSDVIRLAHSWIIGSRHTKLQPQDFLTLPENSELEVSNADEVVTTGAVQAEDFEIGGVRWVRVSTGA